GHLVLVQVVYLTLDNLNTSDCDRTNSSGDKSKCYWTNSVLEVVVGEGAKVNHSYMQTQSTTATHVKWTSVRQESGSSYKLVEVSCGGKLSRHNLHVQQVGPDTSTELSTLHLSMADQTQDLHSRVVLDHPRGYSRQLHKCIVAHSQGQAVFDGNVRVNRFAQQTDAGQLTRTLLLAPRATVNLKPNLQIIADDVKCSHGAAISDLEEDQLFYFQARGIDAETARRSLIFSFGAEVIESIPDVSLREKTKGGIRELLNLGLATPSS
ncbi:ABCI7, chloroplastic-like protein, partial [Drosera capensis]